MNRMDRLYSVREELRRAGSLGRTAEQLARTFEVSTRTIKRDISALQQGGFPVWGYAVAAHESQGVWGGLTPVERRARHREHVKRMHR